LWRSGVLRRPNRTLGSAAKQDERRLLSSPRLHAWDLLSGQGYLYAGAFRHKSSLHRIGAAPSKLLGFRQAQAERDIRCRKRMRRTTYLEIRSSVCGRL